MSEKKSKSKSKEKAEKTEKPPKSKKDSKDDAKSKKSVEKTEKGAVKKKKEDKSEKSVKAKEPQQDLDLSQDNFSDFLKNPFTFPPAVSSDDAYQIREIDSARTTNSQLLSSARSANRLDARVASCMALTTTKCTESLGLTKLFKPDISILTTLSVELCWRKDRNLTNTSKTSLS